MESRRDGVDMALPRFQVLSVVKANPTDETGGCQIRYDAHNPPKAVRNVIKPCCRKPTNAVPGGKF